MTFRERLDRLEITVSAFARWTGFNRKSVKRWYEGDPLPDSIRERVFKAMDADYVERLARDTNATSRKLLAGSQLIGLNKRRSPKNGRLIGPDWIEKRLEDTDGWAGPDFQREVSDSLKRR